MVAEALRDALPEAAMKLLQAGSFVGGRLLRLKNPMASCVREDVENNRYFVLPVAKAYPDRVPSGYFLADVFLELDSLLDAKL